jgi:predicted metal-binding protein
MPQPFRQEETYTVKEIWKELDRKVSMSHIYNLIERGAFGPGNVYRFAGSRGTCVVKEAVRAYKENCRMEVGA